jgi:MFS family permease
VSDLTPLRRNRDFVLLQAGQMLSTIGTTASQIAYPLLVLALTHSPAKAGVVGFAAFVPYVLFGLFAGVAADRWNRKHVMILADIVRVLAMASVVVAIWLNDLTFGQVVIASFVEGTAFVFFNIAEVGALRSVVPRRQLPAAAAAEQARFSVVTLAGPPLGGVLLQMGRSLPFLADGLSYAFSIASLLWMRTPFQEERTRDTAPLRTQIREGISFLWSQKYLRTSALIFAGDNFVFQGLFLALIVVSTKHGLSSGLIGVLIAVFGGCSLAGSLVAPRVAKRLTIRQIMLVSKWSSILCLSYLLAPNPYVLFAGILPSAFISPSLNAVVIGYRTAVTPDHLVGRVSSVARNIALLGLPLGSLATGLLLGGYSGRATVLFLGLICVALAVITTVSPSLRRPPSLAELDDLPVAPAVPATMEA